MYFINLTTLFKLMTILPAILHSHFLSLYLSLFLSLFFSLFISLSLSFFSSSLCFSLPSSLSFYSVPHCSFIVIYLGSMHLLVFLILYFFAHHVQHGCDPSMDALQSGGLIGGHLDWYPHWSGGRTNLDFFLLFFWMIRGITTFISQLSLFDLSRLNSLEMCIWLGCHLLSTFGHVTFTLFSKIWSYILWCCTSMYVLESARWLFSN